MSKPEAYEFVDVHEGASPWCEEIYQQWKRLTDELGPPNPAVIREHADKKELLVVVSKETRTLAGFCMFHVRRDGVAVIYDVATLTRFRGKGIARFMVERVQTHSPKSMVRLKVVATNPANAAYEAMGFKYQGYEQGKKRPLNVWHLGGDE
jgi:ribosomal protein S18 acetylase RimI-like enzyme